MLQARCRACVHRLLALRVEGPCHAAPCTAVCRGAVTGRLRLQDLRLTPIGGEGPQSAVIAVGIVNVIGLHAPLNGLDQLLPIIPYPERPHRVVPDLVTLAQVRVVGAAEPGLAFLRA